MILQPSLHLRRPPDKGRIHKFKGMNDVPVLLHIREFFRDYFHLNFSLGQNTIDNHLKTLPARQFLNFLSIISYTDEFKRKGTSNLDISLHVFTG